MLKIILSSGVAVTLSACIAMHGVMADSLRITGAVGMYYFFWLGAYGIWDWAEDKYKARQQRKRQMFVKKVCDILQSRKSA